MPEKLTVEILIYWIILAAVIAAEHLVLARRWQAYELARRTVGVATVLFGAFPLVALGQLDWWTWIVLFWAFGVAGAVTAGLYTWRWAKERQTRSAILRECIQRRGNISDSSADSELGVGLSGE